MAIYGNINGAQKTMTDWYINKDGASKKIQSFYGNIGGISKPLYSAAPVTPSSLSEGDYVFMNDYISERSEYIVTDIDANYDIFGLIRTHVLPNPINNSSFMSQVSGTNQSISYSTVASIVRKALIDTNPSYRFSGHGLYLFVSDSGYRAEDVYDESGNWVGYGSSEWQSSNEYSGEGNGAIANGCCYILWKNSNYSWSTYSHPVNYLDNIPPTKDNGDSVYELTGDFYSFHWHDGSESYDVPKYDLKVRYGDTYRSYNDCSSLFNTDIYIRPRIFTSYSDAPTMFKK